MSASLAPAILLIGPTASGKTGLAVRLVRAFPLEIISVDSAQIYRGMDIGTAKPDQSTLAEAPHHLLDVLDPEQRYSAAQFRADALALMAEIRARGRMPLLVGGTMLYFRALTEGLAELPAADPAVRDELEAQAREEGWPAMHRQLARLDPVTAARLHPNDAQRVQRALEVERLSGRPLSELLERGGEHAAAGTLLPVVLRPARRAWLHERIERRFHEMLAAGFVDEVVSLRERPGLTAEHPSMRTVGYRQIWQYLDGAQDYPITVQRGVAATRQFAKRQLTWLRRERAENCLDPESPGLFSRVRERITAVLE